MKQTQNILEEASRQLAEVKKLLEKSKDGIKADSVKMSELSKGLKIAESQLRQQNIDFISSLVDTGAELMGSNDFTVVIYPEDVNKKYWSFKKGRKIIIYHPDHKVENFGIDQTLEQYFSQMRSRVTDEVCRLLRSKSKYVEYAAKGLSKDIKKRSTALKVKSLEK
jgi:hypothetical protein